MTDLTRNTRPLYLESKALTEHESEHARGQCECPCLWTLEATLQPLLDEVAWLRGALGDAIEHHRQHYMAESACVDLTVRWRAVLAIPRGDGEREVGG